MASTSTTTSESDRLSSLMVELRQQIQEFKEYVGNLSSGVRNSDVDTSEKGISLLELKCQLMLGYLADLSYVSLRKLSRQSIKDDESIFRLAEIRTVLERIRPIEHKLQYQIDKLIAASVNENGDDASNKDALSYKPNPKALISSRGGEEEDELESDGEDATSGPKTDITKKNLYVPPKLVATPYSEETDKTNKALERARKRALSSSLVRDLQEQYGQGPEEITQMDIARKKDLEKEKQQLNYEEDNFVRLQVTKAQKQAARRASAKSTLDSLLDFGDYRMDEAAGGAEKRKRSSSSTSKRKGKGGSKKKSNKGKGGRRK